MLNTISALLVVLGGLVLLRLGLDLAGLSPRRGRRRLRIVETCGLGRRSRLHVVEVDGEPLLIGSCESSVRLLRRLPADPPPQQTPAEPQEDAAAGARRTRRSRLRSVAPLVLLLVLCARAAVAAPGDPTELEIDGLARVVDGAVEPERISSTLGLVGLLTLVSLAPSILLVATCFTRVLIVLAFLRQALGIQQLPPNQVLVGLALFITLFVMAPLGERIHAEAIEPYQAREIDAPAALEVALVPVREYLTTFTREKDLDLFVAMADVETPVTAEAVPLRVLLPAFVLSELRTAFEIGFMVYLPFLVVDLVVASMLISMGMIVLPPIVVSLPFKLMLFVLMDGWNLVVSSLVKALV